MLILSRRHGSSNWQVRKRWPSDVAPLLGREFIRSTGAPDRREAQRVALKHLVEFNMKVSQARDQMNGLPVTSDLVEVVGKALAQFRSTVQQSYSIKQTISPQTRLELIANLQGMIEVAKRSLACFDYNVVHAPAATALEREGLHLDADHPQHIDIMLLFGDAYIEELEGALARLEGRERRLSGMFTSLINSVGTGCASGDPLLGQVKTPDTGNAAAVEDGVSVVAARTIADLIDAYVSDKESGWSVATLQANRNNLAVLSELCGDARVDLYNRQDARGVFETLKAIPKGVRRKATLKVLPLLDAIEEGKRSGLERLSAKTINDKYLSTFKAMFGWAKREGWVATNHFEHLAVTDEVASSEKRDPFTTHHLVQIFSTEPWAAPWAHSSTTPSRFWLPLISLFHGFRLSEGAALLLSDVREVDGIWCFELKKNEVRNLKTEGSRSIIPIHHELIRIGFLDFFRTLEGSGDDLIFPDCHTERGRDIGGHVSAWFSKHLTKLGVKSKLLTFHSFRHNFEDAMRNAEIPHRTALALGRRAEAGSSHVYGSGLSVAKKAEALALVQYNGLNLDHLMDYGRRKNDGNLPLF